MDSPSSSPESGPQRVGPPAEAQPLKAPVDAPAPPAAERRRWSDRLYSFPWEKTLIWGLFLLVVWVLKDFFLIIFLTFIVTYVMRSIITSILRLRSRRARRAEGAEGEPPEPIEAPTLERVLAVVLFLLLLAGLYAFGAFLGPRLMAQGEALLERIARVQPQQEFDNLVTKTVGAYLFERSLGDPGSPRYERAFGEFQRQGLKLRGYRDFPALQAVVEGPFVGAILAEERRRVAEEFGQGGSVDRDFREWFLTTKAPAMVAAERRALIARWEERYGEFAQMAPDAPSLAELKRSPGFEARRDQQILEQLYQEALQNPERREAYQAEWTEQHVRRVAAGLDDGSSVEFQTRFPYYYEQRHRNDPAALPYSYDDYLALKTAWALGEETFDRALAAIQPAGDPAGDRADFQLSEQRQLARRWMAGPLAGQLRALLGRYLESGAAAIAAWVREQIGLLLSLPAQVVLALLLSFFITYDIPRLRNSIRQLEQSRVRRFYREIAPSLVSFGRLMGRSFQAQGLIALINSLLTFLAIHYLGIQNELVLCAIVFVCSFVPIVGVVLSSVPIAVIAIVQPGGSLGLALKAILAIVVIHFIETTLLNPKIVGDMLHLHPVMVLAVLAIGEHFFGVWGLLLAVPVTVYLIRHVILAEPASA